MSKQSDGRTKSFKISLQDALQSGYGNRKSQNILKQNGYQLDTMLSNHNQQTYYNPNERKLLYNVSGTHNLTDWGTDAALLFGQLKSTNRYKEADINLQKAKQKYGNVTVTVTGHSLGNSIARDIVKPEDTLYGLDAGITFFQPTRNKGGNKHNYRTSGDLISLLSSGATHVKTLKNPNFITGILPYDAVQSHAISSLRNENIFI